MVDGLMEVFNKISIYRLYLNKHCNNLCKYDIKYGLIGEEGEHDDSFFAWLSRVVSITILETLHFREFIMILLINDLRTSDLYEQLNMLEMQTVIKNLWAWIKESRDLMKILGLGLQEPMAAKLVVGVVARLEVKRERELRIKTLRRKRRLI